MSITEFSITSKALKPFLTSIITSLHKGFTFLARTLFSQRKLSFMNVRMMFLLFVMAGVLMFPSCALYKEVEVQEILEVKVIEFDQDGADCEIFMTVKNPNGYKIQLTESEVDMFFEGKFLGKVELLEKIVLPKNSVSTVQMKCLADYESLQSVMGNFITILFKSEYVMEGKGFVRGKALLVSKKFPVEFREKVTRKDMGF
jgi:LEA14-like dessication related protein